MQLLHAVGLGSIVFAFLYRDHKEIFLLNNLLMHIPNEFYITKNSRAFLQ